MSRYRSTTTRSLPLPILFGPAAPVIAGVSYKQKKLTVTVQVRSSDGTLSNEFSYTRPA